MAAQKPSNACSFDPEYPSTVARGLKRAGTDRIQEGIAGQFELLEQPR